MHGLAFIKDLAFAEARTAALKAAHPGMTFDSTYVFSVAELETKAVELKGTVDSVLLAPVLTEEEVEGALAVVKKVWGKVKESREEEGEGMWVVKIPKDFAGNAGKIDGLLSKNA